MTICNSFFPVWFIPLKMEPKKQRQVWETETVSELSDPLDEGPGRIWMEQQLEKRPQVLSSLAGKVSKLVPDKALRENTAWRKSPAGTELTMSIRELQFEASDTCTKQWIGVSIKPGYYGETWLPMA